MEKDIDRIAKSDDTDIVIRIDDYAGRRGVTIREFVKTDRYTGFTKAGTRIPADKFKIFKAAINSIDEGELIQEMAESVAAAQQPLELPKEKTRKTKKKTESLPEQTF